jgi:hypothetical protein
MFFILGFLMAAAGFAMLVQGQFPLGKRQVKSRPARLAGGIWVSYLPLVFAARFLHAQLELEEIIHPAVIYGILLALCLPAGAIIVLRSAYGGTGRRTRALGAAGSRNPFDSKTAEISKTSEVFAGPDEFFSPPPASRASSPKKPGRRPPEKNPFDFS